MIVTLHNILTQIHIFHLSTETYAAHKISDAYKGVMEVLIDRFLEVELSYLKDRSKIDLRGGFDVKYMTKDEFVDFLDGTTIMYSKIRERHNQHKEMQAIIDEIITETRKTIYLLSFQ